jgi:hypothetical protein
MRCMLVVVLAACSSPPSLADAGSGSGSPDAMTGNAPDAPPGAITPTPVGGVIGAPTSATIDPAGTTVVSADGTLELRFPADAVAAPTAITLTPIQDEAPLGVAQAWRIAPADTALAQPATIVFHQPAVVAQQGDLGTMFVTAQDAQGYWQAGASATWDPNAHTITSASALTHLGDWALTSCVGLTTDTILAASSGGGAHLAVVRQCDAPPASGPIGGGTTATDPVVWSDQAEGGGAAGGTLSASGATATLAAPAQPPASPIDLITATVSSASVAPGFTVPRSIMLQRSVAIAGFVKWTVDGQSFTGVLGSSVLSHAGMSSVNAASTTPAASLSIGFPGDTIGSYAATDTHGEVATGTGNDLRYNTQYQDPCTAALEMTSQQVDITEASTAHYYMSGQVHGTLAIARGMKQCPIGPETDIAIVDVDAVFVLMWPGPQ